MSRFILPAMTLTATLALFAMPAAEARTRHRHQAQMRAEPTLAEPAQPRMFYPQDIEGGVPGNLPFNNQIRKHTDPLNANGGR